MKTYVHARLGKDGRATLEALKKATGLTESELVRRGLELASQEAGHARCALELAGSSVGRFRNGPTDLATNKKHLEGFGR